MSYPQRKTQSPIEIRAFEDDIRALVSMHFNNFAEIDASIITTYEDDDDPVLKIFRVRTKRKLELTLAVNITDVPLTINTEVSAD